MCEATAPGHRSGFDSKPNAVTAAASVSPSCGEGTCADGISAFAAIIARGVWARTRQRQTANIAVRKV